MGELKIVLWERKRRLLRGKGGHGGEQTSENPTPSLFHGDTTNNQKTKKAGMSNVPCI